MVKLYDARPRVDFSTQEDSLPTEGTIEGQVNDDIAPWTRSG